MTKTDPVVDEERIVGELAEVVRDIDNEAEVERVQKVMALMRRLVHAEARMFIEEFIEKNCKNSGQEWPECDGMDMILDHMKEGIAIEERCHKSYNDAKGEQQMCFRKFDHPMDDGIGHSREPAHRHTY